jgi:hypothetical protein
VGSKAEQRAAREKVAAYHEARLGELVEHVERAVAAFRAGELNAFEVDAVIHRYHRAARRLWVFCDQSGAQDESTGGSAVSQGWAGRGGRAAVRVDQAVRVFSRSR